LGGFEVTTLLGGTRTVPDPQTIFGMNVSPEEFAEVSEAAFIPTDRAQFFFTPTLVNTGSELILFDTGLSGRGSPGRCRRGLFARSGGRGGADPHARRPYRRHDDRRRAPTFANAAT
jgi:hypothetical protein